MRKLITLEELRVKIDVHSKAVEQAKSNDELRRAKNRLADAYRKYRDLTQMNLEFNGMS